MHVIFQRHHIPPHEIASLTEKEKRFMYASMLIQLEDEEKERREQERELKKGGK